MLYFWVGPAQSLLFCRVSKNSHDSRFMLSDSQGIVVISSLLTTAQLLTNGVFHDEGMLGFETRMIVVLKIVDPQKYGFQY